MWDARAALLKNPSEIDDLVQAGSQRAAVVAKATLNEVTEAMKI